MRPPPPSLFAGQGYRLFKIEVVTGFLTMVIKYRSRPRDIRHLLHVAFVLLESSAVFSADFLSAVHVGSLAGIPAYSATFGNLQGLGL